MLKCALPAFAGILILVTSCARGPEPIRWGTDACDQCRMVLTDRQFGVEFVPDRGPAHRFDGLAELARYRTDHPGEGAVYVTDGVTGGLIAASAAVYVKSSAISGPMGDTVISFARRSDADSYVAAKKLTAVTWPTAVEVLKLGGTADAGH